MIKIATVEYRRKTGKSPYKRFLGFRIGYSDEYVSYLVKRINELNQNQ